MTAPEVAPATTPGRRVLRAALGIAGLVFVAVALVQTVDRSQGVPLPRAAALVTAGLLVAVGLGAAGGSWAVLLGPRGPRLRRVAPGFLAAQLGKYVPGAIWQAVGQVDAVTGLGVPLGRAVAGFGVAALTQLAAAATIGAFVALAPVTPLVRLGAAGGLVTLVLLDPRPMAWVLRRVRPAAAAALPPSPAIRRSYGLALVPQLCHGLAFAVLLAGTGAPAPALAVPAASLAWAAGFVVLPLPAGLGVREAVLLATLGGDTDPAALLAASLALRLVTIVTEVTCWAVSRPLKA